MRKNYILDANILIHDPTSILHFADNTVIIPVDVIGEIDHFKRERTDRGYAARAVVRLLDSLRGDRSLAAGVSLENGGTLRVFCDNSSPITHGNGQVDREILRVARVVQESEPGTPVVIVTKDMNLRIRADAVGLKAEDYETDRVPLSALYSGQTTITLDVAQIEAFKAGGALDLPAGAFAPNEYALLKAADGSRVSALARVDGECKKLIPLRQAEEGVLHVRPRNKEQYFALDALLDEKIELITLMGKAGTGKTLLALAAGMFLSVKKKLFRGVLVCRPIVPVGRDLGFLPGDIGQKLDPWTKPVVDTVEFLVDLVGPIKGHSDAAALMRAGLLEIQPLTYLRGRSIANRFVVIDEAQNLTPLEVKTVMTRIGQAAKIVFTGDPYQIDNPYVDATSNGFTYLVNRFRDQPLAAHIELMKGERSPLAELAANLL